MVGETYSSWRGVFFYPGTVAGVDSNEWANFEVPISIIDSSCVETTVATAVVAPVDATPPSPGIDGVLVIDIATKPAGKWDYKVNI